MPAEAAFDAARELGERIVAQRAEKRQAVREAQNARRRARYAARPKPAAKPKTAVVADDEWIEPGCCCHIVRMPPCGWCEAGGNPYDDESEADR